MEAPQTCAPAWLNEASVEFERRWQTLVSTTNWEKGRIISEWRAALRAADAPATEYSDDAWSQRVGCVTGQHVGRLRRVWDRFGATAGDYAGLHWSHFQAAIEWSDAEMWLEGAVQSGWSVAAMRAQRWEALGAPDDQKPRPEDILAAEIDEDFASAVERTTAQEAGDRARSREEEIRLPRDMEESSDGEARHNAPPWEGEALPDPDDLADESQPTAVRPFEHLPELPADLADAFESFKLAVLRHKRSGWEEIECGAVLQALDALKALVLAPPGDA